MIEDSRPSLKSIVSGPAPRWKNRTTKSVLEYVVGLPACIGLGLAFNIWRPQAEPYAVAVAASGLLLTLAGIFFLARWQAQEYAWQRAELLSRASFHGYSEAEVVEFQEQLERQQLACEGELCR